MNNRVIFMGSPEFALPTLTALAKNFQVSGVVTQPDRPAGRGKGLKPPAVKTLALSLDLPIIQPEKLSQPGVLSQLEAWAPDVIVVVAFGQILKSGVLNLPKYGCMNVHASLLPRWRGAAPINAAILHGDGETGITIMKMDVGLDTGGIISQKTIPIRPDHTAGQLSEILAELGGKLLVETLPEYISGEITPKPQDDSLSTYAPMLKKEDGNLDFSQTAEELARKVRAFSPWPGTFTRWQDKTLKIHAAHSEPGKGKEQGKRTIINNLPGIHTREGVLILDELQPAGKKRMTGKVFLNGARGWAE